MAAEGVSLPPSSPESPHRFLCSSRLLEAARSPGFVALHPQGQQWLLGSFSRCLPPTRTLRPPSSAWKDLCNGTGPGDSRGISLSGQLISSLNSTLKSVNPPCHVTEHGTWTSLAGVGGGGSALSTQPPLGMTGPGVGAPGRLSHTSRPTTDHRQRPLSRSLLWSDKGRREH